jgi:curli production assembly/transport component CsgE
MNKLHVFLSTILFGVFLTFNHCLGQGKAITAQPDSSAEQVLSKPDQRKVPAKKLLEVVDEVLKQKQHKRESSLGYEIDGLIVDETFTKIGRDFYDIFYSNWEAPPKVNNYSVKIKERPLRGRGFQIVIEVNDSEINEMNLQPQYDMIEGAALQAVGQTQEYLYNYENLKEQLETDDQKGTGLY